jgi:hypothetical protein
MPVGNDGWYLSFILSGAGTAASEVILPTAVDGRRVIGTITFLKVG